MTPASSPECLLSNLRIGGSFGNSSNVDIANAVNAAFLEPMEPYEPLHVISTNEDDSGALSITELTVLSALTKRGRTRRHWKLAPERILVQPITSILNASFREQRLPA